MPTEVYIRTKKIEGWKVKDTSKMKKSWSEERRAKSLLNKRTYVMPQETKDKIGAANKGKGVGKIMSEETRKKIGKAGKGREVSLETREKLRIAHEGKHHSPETEFKKGHSVPEEYKIQIREKLVGKNMGEDCRFWKGGLTPLNESIRHSYNNKQWILDVFTRDNFICQKCGYAGGRILVVHHRKEFSKILSEYNIKSYEDSVKCEELWDINNGVTLCKHCHIELHKNHEGWKIEDLESLKKLRK